MRTAVDSSVLLDVLTDAPGFAEVSEKALIQAKREGVLVICETVVAEVRPVLSAKDFHVFLHDWEIVFEPGSLASAELAGTLFAKYLRRNPERKVVVPDFLIGAHAQLHTDRLLARDRGFLRTYFRDLKVWIPS
jgi:predicted nucleic acid-binding protein